MVGDRLIRPPAEAFRPRRDPRLYYTASPSVEPDARATFSPPSDRAFLLYSTAPPGRAATAIAMSGALAAEFPTWNSCHSTAACLYNLDFKISITEAVRGEGGI